MDHFAALITSLVTSSVVLLPILSGATFSRRPERWLPLPLAMGIFIMPLWLMAWDAAPKRRAPLDWIAMCVVLAWLLPNVGRYASFARETESFQRVIAAASPGKRIGTLMNNDGSALFLPPVYAHFHAWYQATRGGIVDFNFAEFFPQIVHYKQSAPPHIPEYVVTDIATFNWDTHGGASYDYFLLKSNADMSEALFPGHISQLHLVTHDGSWWLYRNTARPQ
jgi:hypothetical protein